MISIIKEYINSYPIFLYISIGIAAGFLDFCGLSLALLFLTGDLTNYQSLLDLITHLGVYDYLGELIILLNVIRLLCQFFFTLWINFSAQEFLVSLRLKFASLLINDIASSLSKTIGEQSSICLSVPNKIVANFILPSLRLMSDGLTLIVVAILVLFTQFDFLSEYFTVIFIVFSGICVLIFLLYRYADILGGISNKTHHEMTTMLVDGLIAKDELRIWSLGDSFLSNIRVSFARFSQMQFQMSLINLVPRLFFESLVLFVLAISLHDDRSSENFALIGALILLRILGPTASVLNSVNSISFARAAVHQGGALIDQINGSVSNVPSEENNVYLSNSISPDFTLDINDTVISLSETRSLNIHNFKLSSGLFRLYGSSGSGKTSFLRHLCGIYCAEPPIASYNAKSTDFMQFAYVGQQSVLLEGNLFKNITLSDIDDKEIASKYFHCLDIVGLNYLGADFYAPKSCINVGSLGRELSGGEVQRIGIARALFATNRPFVIFDEALSGVDEKNRDNILRYCMRQSEELHRIFIIASHIDVPQVSGCIKISEDANLTFVKQ